MLNKRLGFIVAGYLTNELTPDTARKIEVLAVSETEALQAVIEAHPKFNPVGVLSEDQIRTDIASAEQARKPGQFGFIVGGYTTHELTPETAQAIAVSGRDATDAVLSAMDMIDGFTPVGAMSEYQMRIDLDLIEALRKQHEIQ